MKKVEIFIKSKIVSVLSRIFRVESAQMYSLLSDEGRHSVLLVYNFAVPGGREIRVAMAGEMPFEEAMCHMSDLGERGVEVDVQALTTEQFDAQIAGHPILRPSDTRHLTIRFRFA